MSLQSMRKHGSAESSYPLAFHHATPRNFLPRKGGMTLASLFARMSPHARQRSSGSPALRREAVLTTPLLPGLEMRLERIFKD